MGGQKATLPNPSHPAAGGAGNRRGNDGGQSLPQRREEMAKNICLRSLTSYG